MRPERSLRAEAAFRERLAALGAELIEPEWLGGGSRHHVRCAAGHDCRPYPTNIIRGIGVCRVCAGKDPVSTEAAFRARLSDLGAELLEPKYLGARRPHHVRCAGGHDCWPSPSQLRQGGPCRRCAARETNKPRTSAAEVRFKSALQLLGAVPLYEEWRGTKASHHIRCKAGHDCWPLPSSVRAGSGVCRQCAGCSRETAEAAFVALLAELGATPLFEQWRGVHSPHHVRCPEGHDCYPHPGGVLRKARGLCRTCAGLDPAAAEAKFRAALAQFGATPLYGTWLGAGRPHYVRCAAGHEVQAYPTNVTRGAICRLCAGNTLGHGEPEFRTRLLELGATPLYEEFLGSSRGHHARCAAGHDCWPTPSNVRQGAGICRRCAGKSWDVFYVVTSRLSVKFGITSGDPSDRLARHAKQGFPNVVRIAPGLPGDVAPRAERAVMAALALAGERPVRGKEYFDISCLGLVVDVADSYTHHGAWS